MKCGISAVTEAEKSLSRVRTWGEKRNMTLALICPQSHSQMWACSRRWLTGFPKIFGKLLNSYCTSNYTATYELNSSFLKLLTSITRACIQPLYTIDNTGFYKVTCTLLLPWSFSQVIWYFIRCH